jgi:uncharacterized lipoprotein NlpE involved in copper resistance
MFKKIVILSLFISLLSCTSDKKADENNSSNNEKVDEQISTDKLDYTGTYAGELPCADCSFIRFKIVINKDNSFIAKYIYEGKDTTIFQDEGMYKWIEDEGILHLKASDSDTEYKFKVGENWILMLDKEGNEFDSSFKEKYYLKRA